MSGRGIESLPKPPKRFRPDRRTEASHGKIKFETKAAAQREDRLRTKLVKKVRDQPYKSGASFTRAELDGLIDALENGRGPPSSRNMRRIRKRVTPHLWTLIHRNVGKARTFTIIPRNLEFAGGDLHQADAIKLVAQLRQTLIRAGASQSKGWLFASVHGEYEPNEDIFRLHFHGIVYGQMWDVIERLRKMPQFKTGPGKLSKVRVKRIMVSRKPLDNLPEPLTYTIQSFWPARSIYELENGRTERQRLKRRIPEPRHTEVLLWLNRWRLNDLTLLMGIQATRSGLKRVKKRTPIGKKYHYRIR